MKFQVTNIDLDFEIKDGIYPPEQTQRLILESCIGCWDADNGDDLIEKITCATGWRVKSIDCVHILF